MTATFLVTLELPSNDASSLIGLAEDIAESLNLDGFNVLSVKPWARDDLPAATPETPTSFSLPSTLGQ